MTTRSTTITDQSWRSISRSSNSYKNDAKMIPVAEFLINVFWTIGKLCTLTVQESKNIDMIRKKLSNRFENTTKRFFVVDFLMTVLTTISLLCILRVLERKIHFHDLRGFSYLVLIKPNNELKWKFILWISAEVCILMNLEPDNAASTWSTTNNQSKFTVSSLSVSNP
jgi:hypothetical protein